MKIIVCADELRDPDQEHDDFATMIDLNEVRMIRNLNLSDEDDAWYGTQDHWNQEHLYDQAAEGAGWDYFEPPAGTMIPGLGEV